eukprot:GHVU01178052.1.p3 GENE.GHVU01178052.1~~GHVU01178052.1.p3  ORF type:complete len:115 (+),score=36.55 GHVU01178052.1:566-910(+)
MYTRTYVTIVLRTRAETTKNDEEERQIVDEDKQREEAEQPGLDEDMELARRLQEEEDRDLHMAQELQREEEEAAAAAAAASASPGGRLDEFGVRRPDDDYSEQLIAPAYALSSA